MGLFDFMKDPPKMEINVAQMTSILEEATKVKFMLNGIKCKVPHEHMYEMITGFRHPDTVRKTTPCFIPEEGNPYPLCAGRNLDICAGCALHKDTDPPQEYYDNKSGKSDEDKQEGEEYGG